MLLISDVKLLEFEFESEEVILKGNLKSKSKALGGKQLWFSINLLQWRLVKTINYSRWVNVSFFSFKLWNPTKTACKVWCWSKTGKMTCEWKQFQTWHQHLKWWLAMGSREACWAELSEKEFDCFSDDRNGKHLWKRTDCSQKLGSFSIVKWPRWKLKWRHWGEFGVWGYERAKGLSKVLSEIWL